MAYKIPTIDAVKALESVRGFIPKTQLKVMGDLCRGPEGDYFRQKFLDIAERVKNTPKTYEQDGLGDNAIAHLHYFSPSGDWYITEKDMEAEQHQAFGYADLGYGGELGYISLVELCQHPSVELDIHWTPKELWKIKLAKTA